MHDHHIGMIVPSSNLTMETELPRMLRSREEADPENRFVFHAARARMQHVTPEQLRAMNAQAERAATELADARPDVVATACLVAIMAQGPGYHCTAEDAITAALRAEGAQAPVISSAGALLDGIAALGAERVAIITPYMKPLTQAVIEYLTDAGVEVVDSLSLEVPDNLAVARLDPADLRKHYQQLDLSRADALVLSACVQMPSLPSIQPVEEEVGIPVLSAATATTYRILQELGLPPIVPNAGRLLAG
ncbi:MAG: Asp/Glu racemase [Pseudonocardia sp.]|jgi:maleate isomerase|uniref:maleate cis-trans isomerase family protein n=1 Tax=Pseudonocardia sp. TaxID=60912 RepID=UPI00260FCC92|nr:aspartate/glutamate racemase family protein [Pseudonocardia sp.]MCU1628093.1 Asp/Glu racemase [Pseudonocardia sp.]